MSRAARREGAMSPRSHRAFSRFQYDSVESGFKMYHAMSEVNVELAL
jgi:hypothetical protein